MRKLHIPSQPHRTFIAAQHVNWIESLPNTKNTTQTKQNSVSSPSKPQTIDLTPASGDTATAGWNPLLYRTSIDVDTRAAPVIDWVINRQAIPKESIVSLVITVWVSATGNIDHFQLLEQYPSGDWANAALSPLQTTAMVPATLIGIPVASTMTLEISFDGNSP